MKLRHATTVKTDGCSGMERTLWRSSILLSIIGLTLYAVGFSTPHWYGLHPKAPGIKAKVKASSHSGLWRTCSHVTWPGGASQETCQATSNQEVWQCASKVMCTTGLGMSALGLAASLLAGRYNNKSYSNSSNNSSNKSYCSSSICNTLKGVGGFLLVAGSVTVALGASLYICRYKSEYRWLTIQYSLVLTIVGTMLLILGGGLQLLSIQDTEISALP